jgi:AcrR family transcriptional regulator
MVDKVRTFSRDESLVDERRKQIVKFATSLFVKRGYDRTTVRELARSLGMSQGGLYHYIGSKEDILQLILNFLTENQMKRIAVYRDKVANLSPTEALRQSIIMRLEDIDDVQDLSNFVNHVMVNLTEDKRQIVYEYAGRIVAYFEELLRKGMKAGEFQMSDPSLVAHSIVVLGDAWAQRRWFLRKRTTLEEYARELVELVVKRIQVRGGSIA